ncbi:MAG TPA: hypothetical protein VMW50_04730 [Dehalococcoidia bacterium]|nr:hypothetical protein [Dehalococcoidia bacterium]
MSWRASGGIKRWAADDWFSKCIREAANNECQHCHKPATDCAHIYGRASFSTRWCKPNALALCRGCHDRFGQHPLLFTEWIASQWPERAALLAVKHSGRIKNNASTRKMISDHYRTEYRAMLDRGDNQFKSWN